MACTVGAIATAIVLAGCNEATESSADKGSAAAPASQARPLLAANNADPSAAGVGNAPAVSADGQPPKAALPHEDAAVIAEVIAGLAESEQLMDGTGWTSGVVGATGTILEADSVDGTGCVRFRSSMDGSLGSMMLVGVACERLGGWSVDELDAEASTG